MFWHEVGGYSNTRCHVRVLVSADEPATEGKSRIINNRVFQSCHYLFTYFVPYSKFGPENELMVILMVQIRATLKHPNNSSYQLS